MTKRLKSLNQAGLSHFLIPMAVVVLLVFGFTFNAVAQQAGWEPSDILTALKGKKVKKVDSQMRVLLNPSPDQKKVTGYIEVSSPGVSLSSKHCKASVTINFVGSKKITKKYKLKLTKPAGIINGYCVTSVSRSLSGGDWTISARFPGNKYIKASSGSTIVNLPASAKSNFAPSTTSRPQSKARTALVAPAKFRIASYNVLGASHTDPGGNKATRATYDIRISRLVDVIRGSNLEVVGLQEFEPRQRERLLNLAASDYDIFPSSASYDDEASNSSIIWKRSRFSFVDGGRMGIKYFNSKPINTPWVKLRYIRSGQEFYVLNAHYPVSRSRNDSEHQRIRENNARTQLGEADAKLASGAPVFIIGDFNSTFSVRAGDDSNRANLVYCILTANGHFRHASDVRKGLSGQCPQQSGGGIDHVYVSDKISVRAWGRIRNANTAIASDHSPAVAAITLNR